MQGLLIGRFNPPHWGHINLIKYALSNCNRLFIVVGSDLPTRTKKNIFFAYERIDMLQLCFNIKELDKMSFLSLQDVGNDKLWAHFVEECVFNNSSYNPAKEVTLFGFNKDASSYYLNLFPNFCQMLSPIIYNGGMNSTEIRNSIFDDEFVLQEHSPHLNERYIHPNVLEWILTNKTNIRKNKINKELQSILGNRLLNKTTFNET
jgi:cytidyltransferase-like protein